MYDYDFNSVVISTIGGRVVRAEKLKSVTAYEVDTSNFIKGIYIVVIETSKGEIWSEKLIKQ